MVHMDEKATTVEKDDLLFLGKQVGVIIVNWIEGSAKQRIKGKMTILCTAESATTGTWGKET